MDVNGGKRRGCFISVFGGGDRWNGTGLPFFLREDRKKGGVGVGVGAACYWVNERGEITGVGFQEGVKEGRMGWDFKRYKRKEDREEGRKR